MRSPPPSPRPACPVPKGNAGFLRAVILSAFRPDRRRGERDIPKISSRIMAVNESYSQRGQDCMQSRDWRPLPHQGTGASVSGLLLVLRESSSRRKGSLARINLCPRIMVDPSFENSGEEAGGGEGGAKHAVFCNLSFSALELAFMSSSSSVLGFLHGHASKYRDRWAILQTPFKRMASSRMS